MVRPLTTWAMSRTCSSRGPVRHVRRSSEGGLGAFEVLVEGALGAVAFGAVAFGAAVGVCEAAAPWPMHAHASTHVAMAVLRIAYRLLVIFLQACRDTLPCRRRQPVAARAATTAHSTPIRVSLAERITAPARRDTPRPH